MDEIFILIFIFLIFFYGHTCGIWHIPMPGIQSEL